MAQKKSEPKESEAKYQSDPVSVTPSKIDARPPLAPAPPKENLLSVRAVESFSDGNLAGFFSKFGYACEWPRDEVRKIPFWLVQRVQQSGGEVELMR